MTNQMPSLAVEKGCRWVKTQSEAVSLIPDLISFYGLIEPCHAGDQVHWRVPVVFRERLERPLCSFFLEDSPANALELRDVLVALLTEGHSVDATRETRVLMELASQSSLMLSGRSCGERLGPLLSQAESMTLGEEGRFRRRCSERLIATYQQALRIAQRMRPGLSKGALHDAFLACPLVFSHAGADRERLGDLARVCAELGVEVDGVLLAETQLAVSQCARALLNQREEAPMHFEQCVTGAQYGAYFLTSVQLDEALARLGSLVKVRDLIREGIPKDRAKRLLRLDSSCTLFEMFRQIHLHLRRFDVLAACVETVLPLSVGPGGVYSSVGALNRHVKWAFMQPSGCHEAGRFSVVIASLSRLREAARKRSLRDGNSTAAAAFWGSWSALGLEAEAAGGALAIQPDRAVGVFFTDEEAEQFAASVRAAFRVPIQLMPGATEEPIVLPPMEVSVQVKRGPLFGSWSTAHFFVWGEILDRSLGVRAQESPEGFSLLTEIPGEEDTEMMAHDTFPGTDLQEHSCDAADEEDSLATLDSFFLPGAESQTVAGKRSAVDLGLGVEDLAAILEAYVCFPDGSGGWVFGRQEAGILLDFHAYRDRPLLVEALQFFLLDKYKEGFAPRSDSTGPVPRSRLPHAIELELIREAVAALERVAD